MLAGAALVAARGLNPPMRNAALERPRRAPKATRRLKITSGPVAREPPLVATLPIGRELAHLRSYRNTSKHCNTSNNTSKHLT